MFVFLKIWRALYSCYLRFEIRPFAILPTKSPCILLNKIIRTMLFRCFLICSSYEKFPEEIVNLKEMFKRNSYSQKCIDRCIKNFSEKLHVLK